jgi:hypothetical protein
LHDLEPRLAQPDRHSRNLLFGDVPNPGHLPEGLTNIGSNSENRVYGRSRLCTAAELAQGYRAEDLIPDEVCVAVGLFVGLLQRSFVVPLLVSNERNRFAIPDGVGRV